MLINTSLGMGPMTCVLGSPPPNILVYQIGYHCNQANIHTHTHMCTHTHTRTCTHTHAHAYTHTHTLINTHTHTHSLIITRTHTRTHTLTHWASVSKPHTSRSLARAAIWRCTTYNYVPLYRCRSVSHTVNPARAI